VENFWPECAIVCYCVADFGNNEHCCHLLQHKWSFIVNNTHAEYFHLSQVILVYLELFWRNSLLKCVLQPKIAKKSLKPLFWGFRVVQGHRCWYHWKARWQSLL